MDGNCRAELTSFCIIQSVDSQSLETLPDWTPRMSMFALMMILLSFGLLACYNEGKHFITLHRYNVLIKGGHIFPSSIYPLFLTGSHRVYGSLNTTREDSRIPAIAIVKELHDSHLKGIKIHQQHIFIFNFSTIFNTGHKFTIIVYVSTAAKLFSHTYFFLAYFTPLQGESLFTNFPFHSIYLELSVAKQFPYMFSVHLSIFCFVSLFFWCGFVESNWLFCMSTCCHTSLPGDLPISTSLIEWS